LFVGFALSLAASVYVTVVVEARDFPLPVFKALLTSVVTPLTDDSAPLIWLVTESPNKFPNSSRN